MGGEGANGLNAFQSGLLVSLIGGTRLIHLVFHQLIEPNYRRSIVQAAAAYCDGLQTVLYRQTKVRRNRPLPSSGGVTPNRRSGIWPMSISTSQVLCVAPASTLLILASGGDWSAQLATPSSRSCPARPTPIQTGTLSRSVGRDRERECRTPCHGWRREQMAVSTGLRLPFRDQQVRPGTS